MVDRPGRRDRSRPRSGAALGGRRHAAKPQRSPAARSRAAAAPAAAPQAPAHRGRRSAASCRSSASPPWRWRSRWSLGVQRIDAPGPLPADKVVNIAPGTDVGGIIDQLETEGVIDSWPPDDGDALCSRATAASVKAGEYLFKQNASLRDVIDTLVSRQADPALDHHSRRPDQRADRRPPARRRRPGRRHPERAARGHADAGHLQVRARHDARPADPQHAGRAEEASWPRSGRTARPTRRSDRPTNS